MPEIMPEIMRYKITATVEFSVDGPYVYAEAVNLAEERLARLDVLGDKTPLNGIQQVKVASLAAERNRP